MLIPESKVKGGLKVLLYIVAHEGSSLHEGSFYVLSQRNDYHKFLESHGVHVESDC